MKAANFIDKRMEEAKFTPREKEVGFFLLLGASRKHIAYELNISVRTIDLHLAKIRRKLGAESSFQAGIILSRV